MNDNEKHPFEDLTDSQLDEIMAYAAPMTDASVENVYNRFRSGRKEIKRKKYPMRFIAALVAVFAVALVGFTNVDNIQRLFQMLFGGAVQLEQTDYSSIGKSVTDNGFRLDVISAVRDNENLYLLAQLFDVEGDRLSEDIYIDRNRVEGIVKKVGENVASTSSIKADLLEYDEANKTAFIGIHARGNLLSDEAAYILNSFTTGKRTINADAAELDLYSLTQNSSGAFHAFDSNDYDSVGMGGYDSKNIVEIEDVKECLVFDTMNVRIPGYDAEHISNLGFKDGKLHLQLKAGQNRLGNHVEVSLRDVKSGKALTPLYSLSFGTHSIVTSKGELATPDYHEEYVFALDSLESLKNCTIHVEGQYYENAYSGAWQVRFDAPKEITSVSLPITGPVKVCGKQVEVRKVTVTPLSVVITSGEETTVGFDVSLIYKDGTKKSLTESGMYLYENGEQERHYTNAFRFREISKIVINGVGFETPK